MNLVQRCISVILIISYSFLFTGCFTTRNIYEDKEIVTTLTFVDIEIVSHQNKMGVLYYTIKGKYTNSDTGLPEYIGDDFPFSTYSDALAYKNENIKTDDFEKVIIRTQIRKELVKKEKKFRPVATGLAIGLPIVGVITIVLSAIFITPTQEK